MKKRNKKKKNSFVKLLTIIIIILFSIFIYNHTKNYFAIKKLLNSVENLEGYITKYTVYGTHLNIEGKINLKDVSDINLVLFKDTKKETYKLDYKKSDNITFKLSDNINDGIELEKLKTGKYIVLLEVDNKYYPLYNTTDYDSTTYYTLTKNNHNNKVLISFKNKYNKEYLSIDINSTTEKCYDIVIDAGHGGIDTGASNGNDTESIYTLDYAKALKNSLESLGLKVKMTRTDDSSIDSYGDNGRAVIPNKVNAKYTISLHLNSNEVNSFRGFEIYKANKTNNTFANILSNNINKLTSMPYSNNRHMKVENGIYVRTYKEDEINSSINVALNNNFSPYNITTETNYLYMIRETGGIMTNAYIDGRDTRYGKNPYYNSNIGSETYLIELGYIINNNDLNIIKNKKDVYINAIKESVKQYLNI